MSNGYIKMRRRGASVSEMGELNEMSTSDGRARRFLRRRWSLSVVLALFAALLSMAQPNSSARADTGEVTGTSSGVSIAANRISANELKLTVTNTSGHPIAVVHGSTDIPADIADQGQDSTVHWRIDNLAAGASAVAQNVNTEGALAGGDVIVRIIASPPQSTSIGSTAAISPVRGAGRSASEVQGHTDHLVRSGSSVIGMALLAFALTCFGICLSSRASSANGRVAQRSTILERSSILQRSTAILGVLSLVVGTMVSVPSASAQQVDSADVVTTLTVGAQTHRLISHVRITYAELTEPDPAASLDSLEYAKAMGAGWNLGNSFDGLDATGQSGPNAGGETAWGNPTVTEDLIHAVKKQGFSSIRIPMTIQGRYTEHPHASSTEYRYVINKDWLDRYKQVVDWALADGLYVMINMHHDSWLWLSSWDGTQSQTNAEYRMYTDFWKQLSKAFAGESARLSFETINEPQFKNTGVDDVNGIDEITKLNQTAYDIIRSVSGNERRTIVMPTLSTKSDDRYTRELQNQILSLHDEHIVATVHYYSEWVYSDNLGKTGFDESLFGDDRTPRSSADTLALHIKENFTDHGIGTVIGEYGLLAYDSADSYLQPGEELKYYEYMNYLARTNGYALMFWDNGSGIDRHVQNFAWKNPQIGEMLQSSIHSRSSYSQGLDTVYLSGHPTEQIAIPLTLNGNTFTGITGLRRGRDYDYDSSTRTVTLTQEYLNAAFNRASGYGRFDELTMEFSSGAPWHEYLVYAQTPQITQSAAVHGTRSTGITVPVQFNGNTVKSVSADRTVNGTPQSVGPNSSWWRFLQYGQAFTPYYVNGSFTLTSAFWNDPSVVDGDTHVRVDFFDGSTLDIAFTVTGDSIEMRR